MISDSHRHSGSGRPSDYGSHTDTDSNSSNKLVVPHIFITKCKLYYCICYYIIIILFMLYSLR